MTNPTHGPVLWRSAQVRSPNLTDPVPVVMAGQVPYTPGGNRFQTMNLYLPATSSTTGLVGKPVTHLPFPGTAAGLPSCLVHVHGGAWRDPHLTARSIEPTVAHAFADAERAGRITAVASLNYTLSPFPTHPTLPYARADHTDPAREAQHPDHVHDVLRGLQQLRSLGLRDDSYVLSGHSAGACLAFQAVLASPSVHGLGEDLDAPRPAALIGLNGLYDLPDLVDGLDASHAHLRGEYESLLSQAFGSDQSHWPAASPARFDPGQIARRIRDGRAPRVVVLDQSTEDQLVPFGQLRRMQARLIAAEVPKVVIGQRCTGKHAEPWEQGFMVWESVADAVSEVDSMF